MSTTHYSPSTSAADTEHYIRGKEDERGVAITCEVPGGPGAFSARARALTQNTTREVEALHYRQSFSDEEFDPKNPEHVQRVNDLGYQLAKRMHPDSDCLVVSHVDGRGRKPHNHILNGPVQSPQPLGSPETMELLTSILAAVEAQNTRIATLTEQQKKLAGFVKVMDEETTRRLERITAPASTSSPFSDVSARIASIESRQNEIASTLGEFAQSLNGESLNAASRSLVAEAQKNRAATASAIEGLKAQAAANQKLVSQVGGAVQRIEKRTEERVEKAVEQITGEATATMTANLDASNARAERIIAATAKLEARQLWSAVAAICLALLPVAVVIAGLWMGIAGLITGVQWAQDVDGSLWLGIGRWLVVGVGLAGAGYGLFTSVRWVAGLVETWKGREMSKWPRWQ